MTPRPLHQLCGQCDVEQNCTAHQDASTPVHGYHCPQNKHSNTSRNTTFCLSVTFHIDLAWYHCRRSCRCSGVKGSARKRCLDLRFASARCLEIVCGTIATPTSVRSYRSTSYCGVSASRTILQSSLLVVFGRSRPGFPRLGTFSCPLLPTISNDTRTIHLASNTARRPARSFHPDDQASLKKKKCL
ncbi:uncharacterized protein TNCV_3844801 [Trichonephila clavipes]|nr:uncharacterized protein TNCV_3844801 [Trichonephila clavipes]